MTALLAFIKLNWVTIAAVIGATGHFFPAKTVARKVADSIVNTSSASQAIANLANDYSKLNK